MDDSAAHQLPVEIWIKIAITLRDTYPCRHGFSSIDRDPCTFGCKAKDHYSVRPLTQTCQYLYKAIQPVLFECISLTRDDADQMSKVVSTLANRPDLQSAVRELRLENLRPCDQPEPFLHVLPLLTEIRFLSLTAINISPPIVELLRNATHLRALHVNTPYWERQIPENWPNPGQFGRNLKDLVMNDALAKMLHNIPKCSHLLAPSLTTLHLTSSFIVGYMETTATLPFGHSLIKFSTYVGNGDQDAFIDFVSQCPNIEQLKAPGGLCNLNLGQDFLPKLRSIEDDGYLTKLLLPGRLIRSITTNPDLDLFARPLPDLEAVYLSSLAADQGGIKIVDAILANCPGLLRLEITGIETGLRGAIREWVRTKMTSDIATLPRLQILRVTTDALSRRPQPIEYPLSEEMVQERETMVRMKYESCPDLYDVWLHPEHAWMYVYADNAWAPTIRPMRA